MWFVRLTSLALLPLLVGPAYGVDITMCGQVVPAGETGVLQADLSGCSTTPGVTVEDGGSVLLNGHSITSTAPGANGIVCQGRCLVKGPGKISVDYAIVQGAIDAPGVHHLGTRAELQHLRRQSLRVEDVNLEDNGDSAILSVEGFVLARNVTATGNAFEHSPGGVVVHARRLFGTNLTVSNNDGWGIVAFGRLRLIDSVVTGNNGDGTGIDISAGHRPRLVHSTCGQSIGPNGSWGVCTGDPAP